MLHIIAVTCAAGQTIRDPLLGRSLLHIPMFRPTVMALSSFSSLLLLPCQLLLSALQSNTMTILTAQCSQPAQKPVSPWHTHQWDWLCAHASLAVCACKSVLGRQLVAFDAPVVLQLQAASTLNQHHQQDSCLKSKPSNPEQMAGTRAQLGAAYDLPPTLAFDASKRSLRWNPNSLPTPKVMAKWMLIWIVEKRKREGAVRMTILMLPAAPTAAKKIWYTKQHSVSILEI